MSTVIKVENLSKQYRLGTVGTGSLAHDLNRTWHRLRGREDPYLTVGEENDRTSKGKSEYVWALRNVNFEVKDGEVLGIIGRNGAGKSTLLKILSRTTSPTTGSVKVRGRVASLLEVGTGFHAELSGRDNVFLNGAILGMTKKEINAKFDEIVDFAGVERYIDTPVKRYSSGMYVRLAFAVAAHLDPEILVVDEVLAVGDSEFQKKALGKMKDVSHGEGRTVLFVSHNIAALKNICTNGILLDNGGIVSEGPVGGLIDLYLDQTNVRDMISNRLLYQNNNCVLKDVGIINKNGLITNGEDVLIQAHLENMTDQELAIIFAVNRGEQCSFAAASFYRQEALGHGSYKITMSIPKYLLNPGHHTIDINVVDKTGNAKSFLEVKSILSFTIIDDTVRRGKKYNNGWEGATSPLLPIEWEKY